MVQQSPGIKIEKGILKREDSCDVPDAEMSLYFRFVFYILKSICGYHYPYMHIFDGLCNFTWHLTRFFFRTESPSTPSTSTSSPPQWPHLRHLLTSNAKFQPLKRHRHYSSVNTDNTNISPSSMSVLRSQSVPLYYIQDGDLDSGLSSLTNTPNSMGRNPMLSSVSDDVIRINEVAPPGSLDGIEDSQFHLFDLGFEEGLGGDFEDGLWIWKFNSILSSHVIELWAISTGFVNEGFLFFFLVSWILDLGKVFTTIRTNVNLGEFSAFAFWFFCSQLQKIIQISYRI